MATYRPNGITNPLDPDYLGEPAPESDGYPDDYADLINGYDEALS